MTAIYLAKVANPRMAAIIHTAVELLAGIPSVVYGLVGMIILVPGIQQGLRPFLPVPACWRRSWSWRS